MKYRRKEVVEAVQWFKDGDHPAVTTVSEKYKHFTPAIEGATGYIEGGYFVMSGDWIIEEVTGKFRPCRPDIFEQIYEKVNKKGVKV